MSRPRTRKSYQIAVSFEEAGKILHAALVMGRAAQIARHPESLWNRLPINAALSCRPHRKMQVVWPWLRGPMLILIEVFADILHIDEAGEAEFTAEQPSAHEALAATAIVGDTLRRTGMTEAMIAELLELSDI